MQYLHIYMNIYIYIYACISICIYTAFIISDAPAHHRIDSIYCLHDQHDHRRRPPARVADQIDRKRSNIWWVKLNEFKFEDFGPQTLVSLNSRLKALLGTGTRVTKTKKIIQVEDSEPSHGREGGFQSWWTTTLSSKVNLPHRINLQGDL